MPVLSQTEVLLSLRKFLLIPQQKRVPANSGIAAFKDATILRLPDVLIFQDLV